VIVQFVQKGIKIHICFSDFIHRHIYYI
jgi:hypothetical protein